MGIIARKADEAGLNKLATEIVGSLLLTPMDRYVEQQLDLIHRLYKTDPADASRKLNDLNRIDKDYQPTDEFLSTTGGQALSGQLARERKGALNMISLGCSFNMIKQAMKAYRKTGLFVTNTLEEIRSLRSLTEALSCCLNWKTTVHYFFEEEFESEYDAGMQSEEGRLKLQTSPLDWSRARWAGDWVYRFKGREGEAKGVSRATLIYEKGDQPAELKISSARLSSSGRINFPVTLAGDLRSLEVEGYRIFPIAIMPGQRDFALAGCRDLEDSI